MSGTGKVTEAAPAERVLRKRRRETWVEFIGSSVGYGRFQFLNESDQFTR